MPDIAPLTLKSVQSARSRIAGAAIRTPLVRLDVAEHQRTVHLKLENLQPIGSFKIRGAANAIGLASPAALARGVYTASAGNMGQGVAWCARQRGIPCSVVVPDRAPKTKTGALERLGARVHTVSFDAWWQTMLAHKYSGMDGFFVHPFEDAAVMAGNGTIALELLEDLANVDAVLVPWGGGGLACGIAGALRALGSAAKVYPVEVDTATPLTASFAAGHAVEITPKPSFVDGMGGKSVFASMWPLAQALVERPLVVSPAQIADAVRMLAERSRIVAEGAGAAPLAAALAHDIEGDNVVCIVSGGNIDTSRLATILSGGVP